MLADNLLSNASRVAELEKELAVRDKALLHLCSRLYDMDGTVESDSWRGFDVEEFAGVPRDGKTGLCYVEAMRECLIDIAREEGDRE